MKKNETGTIRAVVPKQMKKDFLKILSDLDYTYDTNTTTTQTDFIKMVVSELIRDYKANQDNALEKLHSDLQKWRK